MTGSNTIQFHGDEIGLPKEHYITITNHPADGEHNGMDIGNELMEKVGPVILDLQAIAKSSDKKTEAEGQQALADVAKELFRLLPGKEFRLMAKRVLRFTRVATGETDSNGKPVVHDLGSETGFATYFARRYNWVSPLMRRAIEHNGFLGLDASGLVLGNASAQETAE